MWMLRGIMRVFVRPTVVPEDALQRLHGRAKPLLYVLEERNTSDLLALEIACMQRGLRRPGKRLKLRDLDLQHSAVELERRAGVLRRRADRRTPRELARAVAAASADEALELDIVPVAVYWGRAPQREKSFFGLMFSENWALVGPFRRLLSIVFNGRSTLIRFGEPRSIRSYAAAGPDGARGARRLLKDMRAEFRHMRTDTLGPDLSRRRAIVAQVLRTRAVRQAVRQEIRDTKRTRREGLLAARKHALEIAANYSHTFVRIAERILNRFLHRVYDGIEVRNADYIDRLPPACEIVYVPCHRSHFDYLLLSYVIYQRGYAVPYVAAGVNLNLPVIGWLLRKGGAFYIRRSFRGSGLYPVVFMKYVDVMMNRGHPIEFFIEGGRSRTGRLLRPRTGMLSMTVRSFLRDTRRLVAYVPVYFGYDRLLEGETYIDELMGRPKAKETVGGLLRVLPQLRRKHGRVYVSFGEPLLLDSILDQVHADWRQDPQDENTRPAWFGDAVDSVGAEIMRRINSAAAVTPVNLLSVALLAAPRQAMLEADLERQLQLYLDLLQCFPYSPDVSVAATDGASIIRYCEQMGHLERRAHPLGDVLRMDEKNAVLATYYRNNVLHLFAMPSLVACAFLNNSAMRHEDIQRLLWRVYPYVRAELCLRWREDELPGVVDGVLAALARLDLLERDADGTLWRRSVTGSAESVSLSVLAQATIQTVERFYLAIALLLRFGRGVVTPETLQQRCVAMAQRMAMLYGLAAPEFFDRTMFGDFVDLLRQRGVIRLDGDGRLTYDDALLAVAQDARVVLSEQIRSSILQVTHS
jgi:glycerol-3-phosphate O-acyltransferase